MQVIGAMPTMLVILMFVMQVIIVTCADYADYWGDRCLPCRLLMVTDAMMQVIGVSKPMMQVIDVADIHHVDYLPMMPVILTPMMQVDINNKASY